jgi:methylated-DNA-[protein]-cysteine S-methyltransferase
MHETRNPDLFSQDAPDLSCPPQAASRAAAPLFAQGGLWDGNAGTTHPSSASPQPEDDSMTAMSVPPNAACHGVVDTRFGPAMVWLDLQGRLLRLDFHLEQEMQRAVLSGSRRDDAGGRSGAPAA